MLMLMSMPPVIRRLGLSLFASTRPLVGALETMESFECKHSCSERPSSISPLKYAKNIYSNIVLESAPALAYLLMQSATNECSSKIQNPNLYRIWMLSSLYQKIHTKACPLLPRYPHVQDVVDVVLAVSDRAALVLAFVQGCSYCVSLIKPLWCWLWWISCWQLFVKLIQSRSQVGSTDFAESIGLCRASCVEPLGL